MNDINQHFVNDVISKVKDIPGIDVVYFLNENKELIKEHKNNEGGNYLKEVKNLCDAEGVLNSVSSEVFKSEFHTRYFLNEDGLIIISKIGNKNNIYLVMIAGENEPVDLLNLLKICKESHLSYQQYLQKSG